MRQWRYELHGPYLQWTRTAEGKTLTGLPPKAIADRYREWFDNARRLRGAISELEEGEAAVRSPTRWPAC